MLLLNLKKLTAGLPLGGRTCIETETDKSGATQYVCRSIRHPSRRRRSRYLLVIVLVCVIHRVVLVVIKIFIKLNIMKLGII